MHQALDHLSSEMKAEGDKTKLEMQRRSAQHKQKQKQNAQTQESHGLLFFQSRLQNREEFSLDFKLRQFCPNVFRNYALTTADCNRNRLELLEERQKVILPPLIYANNS